jgi:hypothetical protein
MWIIVIIILILIFLLSFSEGRAEEIDMFSLSISRRFFEPETLILENLFTKETREHIRKFVVDWEKYDEQEYNKITENIYTYRRSPLETKMKYFAFTNRIIDDFNKLSKRRLPVCLNAEPVRAVPPEGLVLKKKFVVDTAKIEEELDLLYTQSERINTSTGIEHIFIGGHINELGNRKTYKQYEEAIEKLRDSYPNLYAVCKRAHQYCSGKNKYASFSISKMTNQNGLHIHLDHAVEKRGNIVVVNIGADIFYDMIPVLSTSSESYRVPIASGDMVILDGAARYEWAHSIPDYIYNTYSRYAILLKSIMPNDMTLMPYKGNTKHYV